VIRWLIGDPDRRSANESPNRPDGWFEEDGWFGEAGSQGGPAQERPTSPAGGAGRLRGRVGAGG
jgi:hypothetical protein